MIIARIDNEITARTPRRRGRSFKGALRYLLSGHRDAPRPERVLHAETVNILSDLDEAAHEMAETWAARFRLMDSSGIGRKNGSNNTAPVYHAVISWRHDENAPPPEEMADHAKQLLHLLGLGEHEAVLVVHGDTENPHLHIIANTVHPITGTTAPLSFDKRIMQGFAARYEEQRNQILCKGRFAPDVRGAFNEAAMQSYSRRRDSRPRWARVSDAVKDAKRAALPSVILEQLTRHHSTFTPAELARAVTANTISAREFSTLMSALTHSPELLRLTDEKAATRYTTRTQKRIEERINTSAATLAGSLAHRTSTAALSDALSKFSTPDQAGSRRALQHLLDDRGLSIIVGYAGAGKSTLLKTAADAWRASGYRLRGLALAGRTAETLETDTAIHSGTIAAWSMSLENGTADLSPGDILVVDEAGMVASHQLDRILSEAAHKGAKVVLVGDPEQLQAIEAGGPFRYLVDHYDHTRLEAIWRQTADWMKHATRDLAEGRTRSALAAYEEHGMLMSHDTQDGAIASILDIWLANRERSISQMILTATNADARTLNAAARSRLRELGVLGTETLIETSDGPLGISLHDRVVFGRNSRTLSVKNGTTGTVTSLAGTLLSITLDGSPHREVVVDVTTYPYINHAYALTIHKAQGATVDRAYILAAPNMDRHSAYVALSRHRDRVSLHWSKDIFKNVSSFTRTLSRERLKDVTLDYDEATPSLPPGIGQGKRSEIAAEIAEWARLYEAQRAEAAHYAALSPLRRSFWYAAHFNRFLKAGGLTLAKVHERERAALSVALRRARSHPSPEGTSLPPRRAKPTADTVLGISGTKTPRRIDVPTPGL